MSFVPGFAPDALAQWRALEFELQELVLDEVERLALNPPADASEQIIDLVHQTPTVRHYLFVHLLIDRSHRRVIVVGVGHHARSASA